MNLHLLAILASLCASLFAEQILLQKESTSPLNADFNGLVEENLARWHVPGLSIAVIHGDQTFSKGYGYAKFPSVKVSPSTLFYPGSTTKSFTAAAMSLLIDDSLNSSKPLTWETPISSLIRDDFVLPDDYATSHITIEDALSHRTGMPRHDLSYGGPNSTARGAVRGLRHLPLTAEPRTRWQYCNIMYMVISHVIETLTKSSLASFLDQRIWGPLSMTSTFFSLSDAQAADDFLAHAYAWDNHTQQYYSVPWMDFPEVSGAGDIISNVLDYSRWLKCMMNMTLPLSPSAHQALRSPRIQISGLEGIPLYTQASYALGWSITSYHGEQLIWHNGGLPGFGAIQAYLPDKQWGVAMMGNTDAAANIVEEILLSALLDDLLDIPRNKRFDQTSDEENRIQRKVDGVKHARKKLYPNAPAPEKALPLSLPLDAYAGLYSHPAYRNINFTLDHDAQTLNATLLDRTWSSLLSLTHVSGEFFILRFVSNYYAEHVENNSERINTAKAAFRLGEDGRVRELGLGLEAEMGEEKIWFTRV